MATHTQLCIYISHGITRASEAVCACESMLLPRLGKIWTKCPPARGVAWRVPCPSPWSANPQQQSLGFMFHPKSDSDRSKQTPLEVLILFWWCFQCFDTVLIYVLQACSANGPADPPVPFVPLIPRSRWSR